MQIFVFEYMHGNIHLFCRHTSTNMCIQRPADTYDGEKIALQLFDYIKQALFLLLIVYLSFVYGMNTDTNSTTSRAGVNVLSVSKQTCFIDFIFSGRVYRRSFLFILVRYSVQSEDDYLHQVSLILCLMIGNDLENMKLLQKLGRNRFIPLFSSRSMLEYQFVSIFDTK